MNKIKMIGIDHSKASVAYRELFSFTKASATAAMEELKVTKGVNGCIILSTCNRMELWVSAGEELDSSLYQLLCPLRSGAGASPGTTTHGTPRGRSLRNGRERHGKGEMTIGCHAGR